MATLLRVLVELVKMKFDPPETFEAEVIGMNSYDHVDPLIQQWQETVMGSDQAINELFTANEETNDENSDHDDEVEDLQLPEMLLAQPTDFPSCHLNF